MTLFNLLAGLWLALEHQGGSFACLFLFGRKHSCLGYQVREKPAENRGSWILYQGASEACPVFSDNCGSLTYPMEPWRLHLFSQVLGSSITIRSNYCVLVSVLMMGMSSCGIQGTILPLSPIFLPICQGYLFMCWFSGLHFHLGSFNWLELRRASQPGDCEQRLHSEVPQRPHTESCRDTFLLSVHQCSCMESQVVKNDW